MIDLALLKHFIAVAQSRSFTRASQELHVSQPVVSRSIERLESTMGVKLLERTTRIVRLTPAGEAFLSEAMTIVDRLAVAWSNAKRISLGAKAELKVAICPGAEAETSRLSQAIQIFRGAWPDVGLQLAPRLSGGQPPLLRAAEFDIGIMRLNRSDCEEIEWRVLAREPLMVSVPKVWNLGRSSMNLKELQDLPWLLSSPDIAPETYQRQLELCRTVGFEPKVAAYIEDTTNGMIMIACGMGAAFSYGGVRPEYGSSDLVAIEGLSDFFVSEIVVAWPAASTSTQVHDFVRYLIEVAPLRDLTHGRV